MVNSHILIIVVVGKDTKVVMLGVLAILMLSDIAHAQFNPLCKYKILDLLSDSLEIVQISVCGALRRQSIFWTTLWLFSDGVKTNQLFMS